MLSQYLMRWSYGVFSQFIYMLDYIDGFLYDEATLHLWDEANLIMVDDFLMCSWIRFGSILLSIFASMFMAEIDL